MFICGSLCVTGLLHTWLVVVGAFLTVVVLRLSYLWVKLSCVLACCLASITNYTLSSRNGTETVRPVSTTYHLAHCCDRETVWKMLPSSGTKTVWQVLPVTLDTSSGTKTVWQVLHYHLAHHWWHWIVWQVLYYHLTNCWWTTLNVKHYYTYL